MTNENVKVLSQINALANVINNDDSHSDYLEIKINGMEVDDFLTTIKSLGVNFDNPEMDKIAEPIVSQELSVGEELAGVDRSKSQDTRSAKARSLAAPFLGYLSAKFSEFIDTPKGEAIEDALDSAVEALNDAVKAFKMKG